METRPAMTQKRKWRRNKGQGTDYARIAFYATRAQKEGWNLPSLAVGKHFTIKSRVIHRVIGLKTRQIIMG